jgi:two-component system CheB/CheR fusion protein
MDYSLPWERRLGFGMAQAKPSFVVGIGASAGGIEALEGLFREMPGDVGMAFVVVAHLAPGRESALAEILGRSTSLPVREAVDGETAEAGYVYVIPPDALVSMREGRLRVQKANPAKRERNPVDVFLGSLAQDDGERAIAIILSGAGTDGTLGIKAVKEHGGLTLAQGVDGSRPRHSGMPTSAIATGLIDLVLPVEQIPAKLVDYANGLASIADLTQVAEGRGAPEKINGARKTICDILRNQVGHDFAGYKERTFLRRVQRRMQVLQLSSIDTYIARLRQEPDEVSLLFRDLLIGVTDFFRDTEAFEALEKLVMPRLLKGKGAGDTIRVWCPGCATGEEIYSIAILLRERLDNLRAVPKVQLFATDIDDIALDVARAARYPAALLHGMSPERLRRFFTEEGGSYHLSKQIRDMCVFSSHSVIRDPPFSRIDLISCRNLLIYISADMQRQVIPVFHYSLRSGGFLFLGNAENVSQHGDLFIALDKKHRIFQRREHGSTHLAFPLLASAARLRGGLEHKHEPAANSLSVRRSVETRVLERYAPPHVLVNRDGDVVYYSSRTGKYLEAAAGQPSRQLLAMARKGVRLDLRAALQQAMETRNPTRRERIAIEVEDGRIQLIDVLVEPLPERDDDPLFLVLFVDTGPLLSPDDVAHLRHAGAIEPPVEQLERELRDTRERLQSTIEEYETALEELKSANEELVSVNEELQSANEELETGKEEIQSVNEELHTVNQELTSNIDQLNRANSDLSNLFASTQIAIIFLDRQLVIRSFTPAVAGLFNLIPTDRGRPLADMTSDLDHADLHGDIRAVLDTGTMIERRVSRRDGKAEFLMRLLPYRSGEDKVDGVVLTFVDITTLVEGERQQRTLIHELDHRVRNMLAVVLAMVSQTLARNPAPADFATTFRGRIEALARAYGLVARRRWAEVSLEEVVRQELEPHLLGREDGIVIEGPSTLLPAKAALALGMVVHELATNAVKYGALSAAAGRVAVKWQVESNGSATPGLVLHWEESNGPPTKAPERKGFGTELVEREIRGELRGQVAFDFAPTGLQATISVPL